MQLAVTSRAKYKKTYIGPIRPDPGTLLVGVIGSCPEIKVINTWNK